MQQVWTPSSINSPPYLYAPPFFIFFLNPTLLKTLFDNYLNEMLNENKNKLMRQSYFFIFRRLGKKVCFFYEQHFYKQHQAEIWSEIITISSIKKAKRKRKLSKRKTYWLKRTLLLQNPYIISEKQCFPSFYRQPPIWTTPSFSQRNLDSLIFQKSHPPTNKGWFILWALSH